MKGYEIRDIGQRVRELESQLAAVAELEKKIAVAVPGLAFIYDCTKQSMAHVLGNCEGALGYTAAELLEMGPGVMKRLFSSEDLERIDEKGGECEGADGDSEIIPIEVRIRRKDDELRWVLFSRSVSKRNPDGTIVEIVASITDISRQKSMEKQLRLTRYAVEQSSDYVLLILPDARICSSNKAASEALGYSREEMKRMRLPDISGSLKQCHWAAEWEKFRGGGTRQFESVARRRNGEEFPVDFTGTHVKFEGEEYLFAYVRDSTERKRGEEGLRQALRENQRLQEQLKAENVSLREEIRLKHIHGSIVGCSTAMTEVARLAEQVAGTDATVLIQGETGTGKELMARAIHEMSSRSEGPLVVVNCAAIPGNLVESQLFGRERGAYTGAHNRQIGRFEAANMGTIFLDEIGELPKEIQAKLLRVLQEGQVERLGGTKSRAINVRVIAATNRNLEEEAAEGRFRKDLFYRLNVFPITLPPLRERNGDAPALAWSFVEEFSAKMGKPIVGISRKSIEELENYSWPGNVRELRNVVERAMILASEETLVIEAPRSRPQREHSKLHTLAEAEKSHIVETLNCVGWVVRGTKGAAAALGVPPTTLESRMKKLGIRRPARHV